MPDIPDPVRTADLTGSSVLIVILRDHDEHFLLFRHWLDRRRFPLPYGWTGNDKSLSDPDPAIAF